MDATREGKGDSHVVGMRCCTSLGLTQSSSCEHKDCAIPDVNSVRAFDFFNLWIVVHVCLAIAAGRAQANTAQAI